MPPEISASWLLLADDLHDSGHRLAHRDYDVHVIANEPGDSPHGPPNASLPSAGSVRRVRAPVLLAARRLSARFEGRPILGVATRGAALFELLSESGAGVCVEPGDVDAIERALVESAFDRGRTRPAECRTIPLVQPGAPISRSHRDRRQRRTRPCSGRPAGPPFGRSKPN